MRFLFRENVFGWSMTGLMGKGGAWFIGYSKKPPLPPHYFKNVPLDYKQEYLRTDSVLTHYQQAVNQIDDYFEYSMESKQDQKKVHQILGSLTDKIKAV